MSACGVWCVSDAWPLATFFYLEKAPTDAQLEETMMRIVSLERLRSTVVSVGRDKYAWSVMQGMEKRIKEHVTRVEAGDGMRERKKTSPALTLTLTLALTLTLTLALNAQRSRSRSRPSTQLSPPDHCLCEYLS